MGDRERCIYCWREKPTDAAWERLELEGDEPHAELDALCWEPGESGCIGAALDAGRPVNLADALTALDSLRARLREETLAFSDGQRSAARKLWEAAVEHWHDEGGSLAEQLYDSSAAYPGMPIKGKELYRIGEALGFVEEAIEGEAPPTEERGT